MGDPGIMDISPGDQPAHDQEGINIQRYMALASVRPSLGGLGSFTLRILIISPLFSPHCSGILAGVDHEGIHRCNGFH